MNDITDYAKKIACLLLVLSSCVVMAQDNVSQQWAQAMGKHQFKKADKLLTQNGWQMVDLNSVTTDDMELYIAHVEKSAAISSMYLDSLYVGLGQIYAAIANMCINFRDYDYAEDFLLRTHNCYCGRLNLNDDRMRAFAVLQCNLYYAWNKTRKLLDAYNHALVIYEQIYGRYSNNYFNVLNFTANTYSGLNMFASSDSCYHECLLIADSLYGKSSIEYARVLSNIGAVRTRTGATVEAIAMFEKACDIRLHIPDAPLEDVAATYLNMAALYQNIEQISNAELYYDRALDIFQQLNDSVNQVIVLNNHAALLNSLGDYQAAIHLLATAEDIARKKQMTRMEVFNAVLGNMAISFSEVGAHHSALLYRQLALDYLQQNDNSLSPRLCVEYANVAKEYAYLGKSDSAMFFMEKGWEGLRQCPNVSLNEWESAYKSIGALADHLHEYDFAMSCYEQSIQLIRQLYGDSTHHESIVLSAEAQTLTDMGNCQLALLKYNRYLDIERQKVNQQLLQMEKDRRKAYWDLRGSVSFGQLPNFCVRCADSIPESSALFYDNALYAKQLLLTSLRDNHLFVTHWKQIQSTLSDHSFALEYFRYYDRDKRDYMYAAAMISVADSLPILRLLCSEEQLQKCARIPVETLYGTDTLLYHYALQAFEPYWSQGDTIYFSPDGMLSQCNIELCTAPAGYTMSDRYNMIRLSSTRSLVHQTKRKPILSASVYGGIQYVLDSTVMRNESNHYSSLHLNCYRSVNTTDKGAATYLPGTLVEAVKVARLLEDNHIDVTLRTAAAANEESVLAYSGSNINLLHLSTHGFYWTDSVAHRKAYFSQSSLHNTDAIEPLERCGLLFAGADKALSGHGNELPQGVQDGILTAREISLLDLRDCDLAVLSACETAKGDITSEGVFGLQRAFKMAGVQTIIMSLWPVSDLATQMLMTQFYTNWITKGQSKHEAFRNAQNAVRHAEQDDEPIYDSPYFWAAFIMLD